MGRRFGGRCCHTGIGLRGQQVSGWESERTNFGGAAGPWLPMTENKSTKSDRHNEKDRP